MDDPPPGWAERSARRIVAALLDDDIVVAGLDRIWPPDDLEFGRSLVEHELALMAHGYGASEATLRLTVIRVAREALRIRAAIARLDEPAVREAIESAGPPPDPSDRSFRRDAGG